MFLKKCEFHEFLQMYVPRGAILPPITVTNVKKKLTENKVNEIICVKNMDCFDIQRTASL